MPELADLEARIVALVADAEALLQRGETATRQAAVDPVLRDLGWDTSNLNEVDPEVSDRSSGRVDYSLRHGGRDLALVEAKAAGVNLDSDKNQDQLLGYAYRVGVQLAVLTNGLAWWLYLPMAPGRAWEQRRFARIDFREQDAAGAASELHRFLNRGDSVSGAALREAEQELERQERAVRVRSELRDGWGAVLGAPQGRVRDLLARTVEELAPSDLAAFLRGVLGRAGAEPEPPAPPTRTEVPGGTTDAPTSFRGKKVAAFWLDGARYEVRSWPHLVQELCDQLAEEAGTAFAERVANVRGRTRVYFTERPDDLQHPRKLTNSSLYVEGNLGPDRAARISRRILIAVRGSDDSFHIELADEPASPVEKTAVAPPSVSFKGRSPAAFWLDGNRYEAARWNEVLRGICERLATEAGPAFAERVVHLRGRRRPYFSSSPSDLRVPLQVPGADLYAEGNFSANDCVRHARRVLIAVRGSDDGFDIELAE